MQNLTKKQKAVLDYVSNYLGVNGISPSFEEIRKGLGLKAISTVHEHVHTLASKGYIEKEYSMVRSIVPKVKINQVLEIPIVGRISAGEPIEVIEDPQDTIALINHNIKDARDYYALRVVGNSMIEEGIYHGDTVVIKQQNVAENGQTVVAVVDDNRATLKKIYREKSRFRLEPRNQSMLPFYRKDVEIRGVVVQIISNFIDTTLPVSLHLRKQHGYRTIDLFAGIGGIRLGFENAGFNTVFANDFDLQCKATYDINVNASKLIVEDIQKIDIDDLPAFDFLLAGFPCQPFSIAGLRHGFADLKGRGNLFFDIARIIDKRRPTGFLLENVKNLKSHDGGKTFQTIENTLINLGYYIKTKVLNSMEYGNIPQNRERIYIVGFKNKAYSDNFTFPDPVKLTVKVTDLLDSHVPLKYYYNDKPLFNKLKEYVKPNGVYQWRRQYVRENKKGVCPTLTANMGMGGHNVPIIKDEKGIRKLTPNECARIQGFPSTYKLPSIADSALYKQIGNSVSVPVVEAVARRMMIAMGN